MRDRSAFTAERWGDSAVVCRSIEDRPGPIVEQEFGEFATWTQASTFAARLNAGLEIHPREAEQIITSSILRANELLRATDLPGRAGKLLHSHGVGTSLHLQLMLVEMELAVTFCHIVRSRPGEHTDRLLRNARNTLFDAMHFVCHSDLAGCELEAITERLEKLRAAFDESFPQILNT